MHTKKLLKLRFDIYTGLKTSICSFMIHSLNIKSYDYGLRTSRVTIPGVSLVINLQVSALYA